MAKRKRPKVYRADTFVPQHHVMSAGQASKYMSQIENENASQAQTIDELTNRIAELEAEVEARLYGGSVDG